MTPPADVNDVSELSAEQLASILRFHTREGQVFDHTNDTVVVTRTLLKLNLAAKSTEPSKENQSHD